jgi:hypothetical protein
VLISDFTSEHRNLRLRLRALLPHPVIMALPLLRLRPIAEFNFTLLIIDCGV